MAASTSDGMCGCLTLFLNAIPSLPPTLDLYRLYACLTDPGISSEVVDPVCGCPLLQLLDAAPVCGTNGKTYDSYCRARCEQIELSHLGPCTTKRQAV